MVFFKNLFQQNVLAFSLLSLGIGIWIYTQIKPEPLLVPEPDQIEELIARMPVEQKVGQLFMFGIFTEDIDEWKREFLTEKNIGAVILHRYNVRDSEQLTGLTHDLQRGVPYPELPLLIALNQEGGQVRALSPLMNEQAKEVRSIQNEDESFEAGLSTGIQLRGLGINVNLAPVLDAVLDEDSFMYLRSFSGDPATVALLGSAFIRGQQAAGIFSAAKHFPGQGLSSVDPHQSMPLSQVTREELESHLLPFRAGVEAGAALIMLTPISLAKIDESPVPFSSVITESILRSELGFSGVVLTDDIFMIAIQEIYSVRRASVEAILAGADMVMLSGIIHEQRGAYEEVLASVQSGEISEERLNESLRRIFRLKLNQEP